MDNNLRGIRKARRLTLEEAARLSGLDLGLLSRIERGVTRPSARARAALVELFRDFPEHFLFPPDEASQEKRTR